MDSTDAPTTTQSTSNPNSNPKKNKNPEEGFGHPEQNRDPTGSPLEKYSLLKRNFAVRHLKEGVHIMCRWRDGNYHRAKIIERRKLQSGGRNSYEYYVHYTEFDRRLDEWVRLEQLDLDSLETEVDEKETSTKMTRLRKRKICEKVVEDHAKFDAARLREHEKYTKVKNITAIELGRYEIETWYFSPFPRGYDDIPKLYICEFCLNFMQRKEQLQRHLRKCDLRHPPAYELSKKEHKAGTPEKPLSDLGGRSYNSYWTRVILEILKKHDRELSIMELSEMTAIRKNDIYCTLNDLGLILYNKNGCFICKDHNVLDFHLKAAGDGGPVIDVSKLIWTPYMYQG